MADMTTMTPRYVSVSEAAQMFSVCRTTLYNWAKKGAITIHKRGGSTFIKVAEMDRYIETGCGVERGVNPNGADGDD